MARRKFTKEFKLSAARLVNEQGYSIAQAGKSPGVDPNSVRYWVEKYAKDGSAPAPSGEGAVQVELRRLDALSMAIVQRNPPAGLICHSDRGVQYAGEDYHELLKSHGLQASISAKGDCYDNAPAESFPSGLSLRVEDWATLKTEEVHQRHYPTRQQAETSIFEYIEVYYNRKRLHSTPGYKSPADFEAALN